MRYSSGFGRLRRLLLAASCLVPTLGYADPLGYADALAPPQSLSIGEPSHGRLVNGVKLEDPAYFIVRSAEENFGTREAVEGIARAVAQVFEQLPGGHRLVVGDLSKEHGGRIRPHRSHQSGRDIDLGFFHVGESEPRLFIPVTKDNLDLPRTWALLSALAKDDGVQYVFMDRSVQRLLHAYAKDTLEVDEKTLGQLFEYPLRKSRATLVRHRRGHRNHLHIRYFSHESVAAGTLLGSEALAKLGQTLDPLRYAKQSYHIRKGDTLARVAQKSRVDLTDLMRWNGLKRGSILQIGQSIAIYRRVREPVRPRTEAMVCHAGPFLAFGCVGPDRS